MGNLNKLRLENLTMPEVLSPSALELYAQCPYQWYVQNQLKVTDTIQAFGAIDLGIIAHATLANLFLQIKSNGDFLTFENINQYINILQEIFLQIINKYIYQEYKESQLSALDISSIEKLGQKLQNYLFFELSSFKKFKPWLIEETISGDYAGYKFSGRVDRVDRLNDSFIVIDYKLGTSDAVSFTDLNAQYKYQSTLYAQLLERKYGLKCVGAFYVPISVNQYYSRNKIGGALDDKYFEEGEIFISRSNFNNLAISNPLILENEEIRFESFQTFLDYKEELSSQLINSMKNADIHKNPLNPKGEYCPILNACRKCLK